jgi:hypothetical protein
MRTTAIAAGGRPEDRAKMVSRSVVMLRLRIVPWVASAHTANYVTWSRSTPSIDDLRWFMR